MPRSARSCSRSAFPGEDIWRRRARYQTGETRPRLWPRRELTGPSTRARTDSKGWHTMRPEPDVPAELSERAVSKFVHPGELVSQVHPPNLTDAKVVFVWLRRHIF